MLNLFHAGSSLGVNQSNIILIYAKNAKVTLMHVMPPLSTRREPDIEGEENLQQAGWVFISWEGWINGNLFISISLISLQPSKLV